MCTHTHTPQTQYSPDPRDIPQDPKKNADCVLDLSMELSVPENRICDPEYIAPRFPGFYLCTFAHALSIYGPFLTQHTCSWPLVPEWKLQGYIYSDQMWHK